MNIRSLRFQITAWHAVLMAGGLLIFGISVYLGLERYLYWNLQRTLASQCRTIGAELLVQLPEKRPGWLKTEINEAYAPEVNDQFIRVVKSDGGVSYLSGAPKDGSFNPSHVPLPKQAEQNGSRRIRLDGRQFLIEAMEFTTPDGSRYIVESGDSYQQIEVVLHGLLWTFTIYIPLIISLAVGSGYWLMRRSLQPVDEITSRAEGITSTNLSDRLPVIKTGDELERLSVSLNRMIERLDDAFQHINRFSADASHELRTPLTIMQLELDEMFQRHQLNPSLSDQLASLLEETQRMSHVVESLLAISRMDAGDAKMDNTLLNLGDLVTLTVEQMKVLAEEKSIALKTTIENGTYIKGDRTRLQQAILNLVANAIKYTQEGGTVAVCVRGKPGIAALEVSDNGPGIPEYAVPHVFERFYRADKARSRNSGGAGLGLAIVKAICAAHGANVSVSSKEGHGSLFKVEFPRLDIAKNNQTGPILRTF